MKPGNRKYAAFVALVLAVLVAACAVPVQTPTVSPTAETEPTGMTAPVPVEATQAPTPTTRPTDAPAATPEPTVEPTPEPSAAPVDTSETAPDTGIQVDMDKIFPPGPGRDLTLAICTGCHSYAPIVIQQKLPDEWRLTMAGHRAMYVTGPSDADYELITQYLIDHFNPDHPIPEIPPELLGGFVQY